MNIDKKRTETHLDEVHVALTATTEEMNRLRNERLELLTCHQREISEMTLNLKKMEETSERNQQEIMALRTTIGDQLDAMSTLTTGARQAVTTATHQTDAMNDEIGRLKQDMILAKQYKLHTVMEKVTKAGMCFTIYSLGCFFTI
jgi:uncharacterized protein Yka (UPF0111/DUF47 family)